MGSSDYKPLTTCTRAATVEEQWSNSGRLLLHGTASQQTASPSGEINDRSGCVAESLNSESEMNSVLKYSSELSQRLSLDVGFIDANNNGGKTGVRGDKYSLRPRSVRRDDDETEVIPLKKPKVAKPKQKPAPLSRYRRKTANARERSRMREINTAFETLRKAVPHLSGCTQSPNEKLTKITTLRLAMKYINALSSVLKDNSVVCSSTPSSDLGDLFSDCSDLDCLLLESDGESLQLHSDLSDHSLTPADLTTDIPDFDDSLSPPFSEQTLPSFDPFFDFS